MELQVGVKVLLKNPEGKYLLIRRAPAEKNGPGKWDIPGGRMEAGSTMMENLAREVMEETGLTMTSEPKVLGIQDMIWPDRHVVRITHTGTIEGTPSLSHEHTEYKWFTIDEILELEELEFDKFLRRLIEDNKKSIF
ncbi:MAG: NUDIX domain-containing protein [Candidatus Paceibacterota bacterium]